MIDHYAAILLFKPKNWVLRHQPAKYATTEASLYLIPKAKKKGSHGGGGGQPKARRARVKRRGRPDPG